VLVVQQRSSRHTPRKMNTNFGEAHRNRLLSLLLCLPIRSIYSLFQCLARRPHRFTVHPHIRDPCQTLIGTWAPKKSKGQTMFTILPESAPRVSILSEAAPHVSILSSKSAPCVSILRESALVSQTRQNQPSCVTMRLGKTMANIRSIAIMHVTD
jgi:hypothetical protein